MLSYVLAALTFAIGLTSALFDLKKKDADGKTIVGRFGLPKLTTPGMISLLFLVLSFIATFASTVVTRCQADRGAVREAVCEVEQERLR